MRLPDEEPALFLLTELLATVFGGLPPPDGWLDLAGRLERAGWLDLLGRLDRDGSLARDGWLDLLGRLDRVGSLDREGWLTRGR